MSQSRPSELPRRLPGIDVLRALAASAVVLAHLVKWPWGYAEAVGPAGVAWRLMNVAAGTWGVGIFFVLSGACIHLPIARRLGREVFPVLDLPEYFRRRFRRIYPPHLVAIFLSWAVAALVVMPAGFEPLVTTPTPLQLWAHLGMIHTFVPGATFSISAVLWSIALEAHFYLLYPLLLIARRRFRMETICGALFAVMIGLRLLDHVLPPSLAGVLTYNFLGRWWEWVLGAVVAERLVQGSRARTAWPWALVLALASAAVVTAVARLPHGILFVGVGGPLLYGAVVFVAALMRPPARGRVVPVLEWIGGRSYSLYLIHPVALTLVVSAMGRGRPAWMQTSAALGCVCLCSWLYFVMVESRFMPGRRAPVAAAAEVQEPSPGTT